MTPISFTGIALFALGGAGVTYTLADHWAESEFQIETVYVMQKGDVYELMLSGPMMDALETGDSVRLMFMPVRPGETIRAD